MLTTGTRHKIGQLKILVVGDVMVDEYIYGNVSRVSPEAPVPIIATTGRKAVLGGAANVAAGISALGAAVTLSGAVGKDAGAGELRDIAAKLGIDFIGITSGNRKTTVKTRIVGNGRQIVRYDNETIAQLSEAEEAKLLQKIQSAISGVDIVVISDYAKGVCSDNVCRAVVQMSKQANKAVVADTKKSDWSRFSGAEIIVPNFEEFKSALSALKIQNIDNTEADIVRYAGDLAAKYDISGILVTRSQHGMTYVTRDNSYCTVNAAVREVYDVSGAGDTVVAFLAVFLALGETMENTISIANTGAGISVGKPGTYAVTYDDIAALYAKARKSKLYTLADLEISLTLWREGGRKIVFTNGCFDVLHSGHISLLTNAKNDGELLIVGLNSDSSVRRLKGKTRPVCAELERATVLAALEAVDAVVIFDEDTPLALIQKLKPDVLVKGGDYTESTVVGADYVKSYGGKIALAPLLPGKSTTSIFKKIKRKQFNGSSSI